jgi:tetratricopeptide (TPR) repeat protein
MEDYYDDIEQYLDGAMSDAERLDFEAQVAADAELAQALVAVREARTRLAQQWAQAADETALRNTLGALGQQHFGLQASATPRRYWWRWAAAAAVAVAVVAGTVLMLRPQMDERLYARYRHLPTADFTVRGNDATQLSQTLREAAEAYNEKSYARALTTFQKALQLQPNQPEAQFFAALCHLELNQMREAETLLEPLANSGGAWASDARWYLALSHLRRHDRAGCAAILQQFQSSDTRRYQEAQELLKKMGE